MVILLVLAVITNHPHALGEFSIIRGHSSRFSARSEIFPRIKAKCAGLSKRAGFLPAGFLCREILSPMSLAGVFEDHQTEFVGDSKDRIHVAHLTVKVYGNDGLDEPAGFAMHG